MDQEIDESSPLINTLILSKVFEQLDDSSLKEVRQVCHRWNGVAASILAKRSFTVLKSNRKCEVNQYQKCYSDYGGIRTLPNGYGDVDHKKLNATLNESANPEVIFQNLLMDFAVLKDAKFLRILKEYGPLVKSVLLSNCSGSTCHGRKKYELQKFLHPLLTQYCPNLVHLMVRVHSYGFVYFADNGTLPPITKINESLNLESIEIHVQKYNPPIPEEYELKFLLEVIKSSPRLKRLNVTAVPASMQSLNFCQGISTLVNLEEFRWAFHHKDYHESGVPRLNTIMDMFQIICKMDMKKLRILSLSNLHLSKEYTSKIKPELLKFFKRNGRNLRSLMLMDVDINWDETFEDNEPLFFTLEFQEMLTFCSGITSIHIKAFRDWYKITDLRSWNLKPCRSLKNLVLSNRTVSTLESFNAIVEWFPNLVYFGLEDISDRYYVLNVIQTLESLDKLQELELGGCFKHYHELTLVKLIQVAKNVPGLRRLTITDESGLMGSKMEGLQDALMQTKGFDLVRFGNFLMDGDEDKFGLTTLVSENKLPVNFFSKRERERFRVVYKTSNIGYANDASFCYRFALPVIGIIFLIFVCFAILLFCFLLYVVFKGWFQWFHYQAIYYTADLYRK